MSPIIHLLMALLIFRKTPTAIGVRLMNGVLEMAAPHGIQHLVSGIVAPTPYFYKNTQLHEIYQKRIYNKQWQSIWPKLLVTRL